jgi:metal-responsive CopG/Arc/MetJ family transcriptional regulator
MAKRPNPSIPEDLYQRVDEMRVAEGYTGGLNSYIVKILREYVTKRDLTLELRSGLEAYTEECVNKKIEDLLASERFKDLIRALMDEEVQEGVGD